MLLLMLTWITLCMGFIGGFLDFDELKNVYYGIDISDTPLLHPLELPSDAVILSSKYGQLYQCTYPPVPSQANGRVNESQANNVSVSELLNPMKQLPCLFTTKGWWTYEFCYGREVKQYHSEDGKIVGDVINLGIYDVRNDIVNDSEKVDDKQRQKSVENYHHHVYVNGTMCDLTGRMRETEVRFVCQEGHGDFVHSIEERETCSYIVTVHTSRICSHPSFAPPVRVKSLPIACNPLLNAADYDLYMKEFPSGVMDKHSTAADRLRGQKVKSTNVVQKLLIESMLKSIQSLLKQQQQQQQPDGENAKSSSELTSPSQQTDGDTSPLSSSEPASDETVVDKPDEETPHKAETDRQVIDSDTRTSVSPSDRRHGDGDETETKEASTDKDKDNVDSMVDTDTPNNDPVVDSDEDYVQEFENEMKDIASTTVQRERLAKYKDSIASAMQAQFSDILHEAQADMAREGEEVNAVSKDAAFKNLAKTLSLLLERLEKMNTDTDGEQSDDGGSVGRDTEAGSSVTMTTDEEDQPADIDDDDTQDDSEDSVPEKQIADEDQSDTETLQEDDKVATKEDDVDDDADSEISPSEETIRDRLEKAGINTRDRKLDLKIISEGNTEYTSVQLFSNEDGSPAGRVLIAIIGDDEDAVKEQERSQRLEENYQFKWTKNQNDDR